MSSHAINAEAVSSLRRVGKEHRHDARRGAFLPDAGIRRVVFHGAIGSGLGLVLDMSAAFGVKVAAYLPAEQAGAHLKDAKINSAKPAP